MAYNLQEADTNKIVFVRENPMRNAIIFVVLGTIFLTIGIGLNIFSTDTTFPFILFRILCPFFGLLAIVSGIAHPKNDKAVNPQVITFDHSKGVVAIEMGQENLQTGYIRYDEIERFGIHIQSSSSSSSSRTTNRSYTYYVYLRKKDGGEWYLTQSPTQGKADAILQQLTSQVHLDKPASHPIKPVITDKITKDEKIEKTTLLWENKVTFVAFLYLGIFAIIFLSVISVFITSENIQGFGVFGYGILGFILIIFFLILVSNTRKLIKDATTRYGVTIGKLNLEYNEYDKSTEAVKSSKALPLKDVHSISYTFSPLKDFRTAGLEIRTAQQDEDRKKVQDNAFEMIKYLMKSENQPIKLHIKSLNAVECLQLEVWLQEVIKKKGNESVL